MSSLALRTAATRRRPAGLQNSRRQSAPLHLVAEPSGRTRSKSKLIILFSLIAGLVLLILAPLLINTQLAVLSYEIHQDEVALAKLEENNQLLQNEANQQSSAQRVRVLAEENGLVPAGETGYLSLSEQTVTGGSAAEAEEKTLESPSQTQSQTDAHSQELANSQTQSADN